LLRPEGDGRGIAAADCNCSSFNASGKGAKPKTFYQRNEKRIAAVKWAFRSAW